MATPTENFPLCTSSENALAAASSASCYHRLEYISIIPVVVAELKLGQVERQIFFTHFVVSPNHAALEQAPKGIQIRCMNIAAHIFAFSMGNGFMGIVVLFQVNITMPLVGRDERDSVRNGLLNKTINSRGIGFFDDLRNNISLARDRANDTTFATRPSPDVLPLGTMFIFLFPADIGFVYFYFAHKLGEVAVLHSGADSVAHIPGRAVVTAADLAMNLKGGHTLLALGHKVNDFKPRPKRVIGILEHGSGDDGKAIAVLAAAIGSLTEPVKRAGLQHIYLLIIAAWAMYAIGPAQFGQILLASLFRGELRLELMKGHIRLGAKDF